MVKLKNRYFFLLAAFCGGYSCMQAQSVSDPLLSGDNETLLQKVTNNKRDVGAANMNVQFCTSANASFSDGKFQDASFKVDRIRYEFFGEFKEKFSYHFRQAFNKYVEPNASQENLAAPVELAFMGWQINDKVSIMAGKQAVQMSGYECWVNAIKVRYYSDFNMTIPAYITGFNLGYNINKNQTLNFQIANNRTSMIDNQFVYPLPEGVEDTKVPLLATANWDGYFVDRAMQLRYSLSYGQQAKGANIFYFTCGNVWDKKPFLGYIDFMYSREGLDSKGFVSSSADVDGAKPHTVRNVQYFTTIANLDYRVTPHLNVYAKGVFETGGVFKTSEDFEAGNYRRTWNVQFCAEYFPMADEELKVYLHLLHKNVHLTERARAWGAADHSTQRISLGLVYTLPVF